MTVVTVHRAETQLSKLLARVQSGEEMIIAEGREPVARLVPFDPPNPRRPGRYRGTPCVTPAFFDPFSDDESAAWGTE